MKHSTCFKEFSKYTIANVFGMLSLSCYILADTFFVSKGLGANGLTALNLAIPIYSFIHGSGLMIGIGGATKYAIHKSQSDQGSCNAAYVHALTLAICFSIFFLILGIFFTDSIVSILGADSTIHALTTPYLKTLLIFSPFFILNNVVLCFVRNDGAPKLAMMAMIVGSFSNIILDWVFIFPLHMGMFGAAFATGLSPVISLALCFIHFIKKRNGFHLINTTIQTRLLRSTLSIGLPSFISEASSGLVIIMFNFIILNIQGNVGVAAYGIIANISLVVVAIYTGIAQGIQPLLSKYFGKKESHTVNQILHYALITAGILSVLIYCIIFIFTSNIVTIFNSEHYDLLQRIAMDGLKIYFFVCPFVGFNIILCMYLSSTSCERSAQIIALLRGAIIIIPIAFLLSNIAGLVGVWVTFPLTECIVSIIGLYVYNTQRKLRTLS